MNNKVIKNILWNAFGTVFYFGCFWLITVFVVNFKNGYQDAGVLSLGISLSSILVLLANMNLRTFQVSELDGQFSDGDFLVSRILSSIVTVIICVIVILINGYNAYTAKCVFLCMLFRITEAIVDVFYGMDQRAWRLDIAGKSLLIRGVIILVSVVCGIVFGGSLPILLSFMTVFSFGFIFLYDFRSCKKCLHSDISYSFKRIGKLIKIATPLWLFAFILNLFLFYPKFEIEKIYGEELLGFFSSVSTPTVLVTQMAAFIFNPLMGLFAEYRKEHDRSKIYRLLGISLGGTLVITLFAVVIGELLGEWALVLLFGESIRPYEYLLIPIIITAGITAVIWLLCSLLTVFKDFVMLAVLSFVSLIVCVVSSKFLIAAQGLMGAVIALGISLGLETFLLSIRFIILLKKEKLLPGGAA